MVELDQIPSWGSEESDMSYMRASWEEGENEIKLTPRFWIKGCSFQERTYHDQVAYEALILRERSTICNLRRASPTAALEIDPLFFTKHELYFDRPSHFADLMNRLKPSSPDTKSGFRFTVFGFLLNCSDSEEQERNDKSGLKLSQPGFHQITSLYSGNSS